MNSLDDYQTFRNKPFTLVSFCSHVKHVTLLLSLQQPIYSDSIAYIVVK